MRSTLIAIAMLAAYAAVLVFAHGARADDIDASGCSSALERDAMAEYDYLANHMLGIPKDSPIFKLEKREYVTAVCLHDLLNGSAK